MTIFERAIMVHFFVDWFLQNEWMAKYKVEFGHPAGLLHAFLHFTFMLLVFPLPIALFIGIAHYIIDLRTVLAWWRTTIRQTTDPANPYSRHVAIWQDQVAHLLIIVFAIVWMGQ